MDDLKTRSKVKLNFEVPEEIAEDYTYEMGRLKFKVSSEPPQPVPFRRVRSLTTKMLSAFIGVFTFGYTVTTFDEVLGPRISVFPRYLVISYLFI